MHEIKLKLLFLHPYSFHISLQLQRTSNVFVKTWTKICQWCNFWQHRKYRRETRSIENLFSPWACCAKPSQFSCWFTDYHWLKWNDIRKRSSAWKSISRLSSFIKVEYALFNSNTRNTRFVGIPRCWRTTAWDSLADARVPCILNHYSDWIHIPK